MVKRGCFFRLVRDKKGAGENIVLPIVIFIVLNLIFFVSLIGFVFKASTGALVYEQAYSKQIALILDRAEPLSQISVDFQEGLNLAEKNELNKESLVKIENNIVTVKLGEGKGYGYSYFSDYDISHYFDENFLIINVNEKNI